MRQPEEATCWQSADSGEMHACVAPVGAEQTSATLVRPINLSPKRAALARAESAINLIGRCNDRGICTTQAKSRQAQRATTPFGRLGMLE